MMVMVMMLRLNDGDGDDGDAAASLCGVFVCSEQMRDGDLGQL